MSMLFAQPYVIHEYMLTTCSSEYPLRRFHRKGHLNVYGTNLLMDGDIYVHST